MASATDHRVSAFDTPLPDQPRASEDPPDVLTSFRRALCEPERSIDGPYSSTASLRIDGALVALEGLHHGLGRWYMTSAETAALEYLNAGLSVIPTRLGEKRPSFPWKEYQERRATEAEVRDWYTRQPSAGAAIVCGAVSGILVVDGDPRNGDGLAE